MTYTKRQIISAIERYHMRQGEYIEGRAEFLYSCDPDAWREFGTAQIEREKTGRYIGLFIAACSVSLVLMLLIGLMKGTM